MAANPQDHGAHHEHRHHSGHDGHQIQSINKTAFMATVHCLTGCTIGEVLGMVIGTAFRWGNWETVALAIVLLRLPDDTVAVAWRRYGMGNGTRTRIRIRYSLNNRHGAG
jgi:hypothetical protein